jgi:hypothetical protein
LLLCQSLQQRKGKVKWCAFYYRHVNNKWGCWYLMYLSVLYTYFFLNLISWSYYCAMTYCNVIMPYDLFVCVFSV